MKSHITTEELIEKLKKYPNIPVYHAGYLGGHEKVVKVTLERSSKRGIDKFGMPKEYILLDDDVPII